MRGTKPLLQTDDNAIDAVPRPPRWLSAHAKAVWRDVMPALVGRKILTDADMNGVAHYCTAAGNVVQLAAAIKAQGEAIDPQLYRLQDKAMTTARQLGAELGLSPISRSRPAIRDDENDDDLSELDS